jgi:predicted CoA-binding protein
MPTVAIVGASPKPDRYSYQAVLGYRKRGYTVWPINPTGATIDGIPAFASLDQIPGQPDLVCLYVNPDIGLTLVERIAALKPKQVWLNPGADGPEIATALRQHGLVVIEACTLVALSYGDPLTIGSRMT